MELRDYQLRAIEFIKDKKKCALHLDMGIGKTASTLTAIQQLLDNDSIKKVLIIAPLEVAKSVWHEEAKNWQHLQHLTFSFCLFDEKIRLKALKENTDIIIINRENIQWLYKQSHTSFDFIVIDESTSFKNHTSKRFKSLKLFKYEYMVQLTGTPSPNNLLDIWSQYYLLDKGKRLGSSMFAYKNKYFYSDFMGYKFTPKKPQDIYDAISDITLTMKAEDYLTLPEKINVYTKIDLPYMNKYKELKREFFIHIKENDITAINSAVLTNKLLQFCNGAMYDENKNIIQVHDAKLDTLEEIIDNNSNENIIVAYNYKSDLLRLKQRFKEAMTLDSTGDTIKLWNEKKIKLLLCHPASAGKGINLQHGGNIIIWFGLTWNLEDYLQFNARLYRQGQQKPVIINHIIAKDCIDEIVLQSLQQKDKIQNNLLRYLKNNFKTN